MSNSGGLCGLFWEGDMGDEKTRRHSPWSLSRVHFHVKIYVFMFSVLYVLGVMRVHNLFNGGVCRQGDTSYYIISLSSGGFVVCDCRYVSVRSV